MKVIPPIAMNDTRLTSSTVPENDYAAYSAATTYALGDRVISAHRIYESLASNNLNNALTNTAKWLDIGPTNRWAMFDTLRNTPTTNSGSISVVITPGLRFNSLALLGMVANSVTITVTSGGPTIYSRTVDLNSRVVGGWYDFFYEPFSTRPSLVLFDLPPVINAVLTVTLTATTGNAECGALVIGSQEYIGATQYSATSDVLNFSTVTRDFDGSTGVIVQRRRVPKTNQTVWCDKSRVDRVRKIRDDLDATPAVWSGLDDATTDGFFESLLILGFYKRFSINIDHPETALINLELEEI